MLIYVDADASPVKDEIIKLADEYDVNVTLVASYAHYSTIENPPHVKTVFVDAGPDAADYKITALAQKGDLVITQDYGLASLLLPKGVFVMHHSGKIYTSENITQLLSQRHLSAEARRAGTRTKGPKAFSKEDRHRFQEKLEIFLRQKTK